MIDLHVHYENELKLYCRENQLDYQKVCSSPKCGNESILFIQHVDFSEISDGRGLKNEEPAEVLLMVKKNQDGTIRIEKGENAYKYLHI